MARSDRDDNDMGALLGTLTKERVTMVMVAVLLGITGNQGYQEFINPPAPDRFTGSDWIKEEANIKEYVRNFCLRTKNETIERLDKTEVQLRSEIISIREDQRAIRSELLSNISEVRRLLYRKNGISGMSAEVR